VDRLEAHCVLNMPVVAITGAARVGDPALLFGVVAARPAFDPVGLDADGLVLVWGFRRARFRFQRGAACREHGNGRFSPGNLAVVGVAVEEQIE
jgi:hypothetical protein